jgi:hypothetical protein
MITLTNMLDNFNVTAARLAASHQSIDWLHRFVVGVPRFVWHVPPQSLDRRFYSQGTKQALSPHVDHEHSRPERMDRP